MADFLSRLIERTMTREPAVAPIISPMYAQERNELHQEMSLQVIESEDDHPSIVDIPPIGASLPLAQSGVSPRINPQQLQFPQQVSARTDLILSQEKHLSTSQVSLPSQSSQRGRPPTDKQLASDQHHKPILFSTTHESAASIQREPLVSSSQVTRSSQQQKVSSEAPPTSLKPLTTHFTPILEEGTVLRDPGNPAIGGTLAQISSVEGQEHPTHKQSVSQSPSSKEATLFAVPIVSSSQVTRSSQQQKVSSEAPPTSLKSLTTRFTPILEEGTVLREPANPAIGGTLAKFSSVEGQEHPTHKQSVSQSPSSKEATLSAVPTIQVTIGRIEVKATQPSAASRTQPSQGATKPTMSLDQYLQQRGREGR